MRRYGALDDGLSFKQAATFPLRLGLFRVAYASIWWLNFRLGSEKPPHHIP